MPRGRIPDSKRKALITAFREDPEVDLADLAARFGVDWSTVWYFTHSSPPPGKGNSSPANRGGRRYDGHKRGAIEKAFYRDPRRHPSEVAAAVGCSAGYAAQVIALLKLRAAPPPVTTATEFAIIADACRVALDVHQKRVDEEKGVEPASDFARWLAGSGIVSLCARHGHPDIEVRCRALIQACNGRFEGLAFPKVEQSKMQSLEERIDKLTAAVERMAA